MPLGIDAKPSFDQHAALARIPLSDYTFANNFIWHAPRGALYLLVEGCFCLFSLDEDCLSMPIPPLGLSQDVGRALAVCFDIMNAHNPVRSSSAVYFVDADLARLLGPSGTAADWQIEPGRPDFVYVTADLIELKGGAYRSKRNEINHFRRSYPDHRMETLGPEHTEGIRALLDTWLRERLTTPDAGEEARYLAMAEHERRAVERSLAHYDALGLHGLCLLVAGRLEGFTFGDRITPDVGNVLVEKSNLDISGSAQYLFREFAKTFPDCTFLNVGDDLGLENLRRVKMSYRPARLGHKVTLRLREA